MLEDRHFKPGCRSPARLLCSGLFDAAHFFHHVGRLIGDRIWASNGVGSGAGVAFLSFFWRGSGARGSGAELDLANIRGCSANIPALNGLRPRCAHEPRNIH
jgi:hypothetical protein